MKKTKKVCLAHVHDAYGNNLFLEDVGEHIPWLGPQLTLEIQMRSPLASASIVDLDRDAARRLAGALLRWAEAQE